MMCVAAPYKILKIEGPKATVESAGVLGEADISLVGEVKPGDYVLIHAGFALTKLDPAEAEETRALFDEIYGGGGA